MFGSCLEQPFAVERMHLLHEYCHPRTTHSHLAHYEHNLPVVVAGTDRCVDYGEHCGCSSRVQGSLRRESVGGCSTAEMEADGGVDAEGRLLCDLHVVGTHHHQNQCGSRGRGDGDGRRRTGRYCDCCCGNEPVIHDGVHPLRLHMQIRHPDHSHRHFGSLRSPVHVVASNYYCCGSGW